MNNSGKDYFKTTSHLLEGTEEKPQQISLKRASLQSETRTTQNTNTTPQNPHQLCLQYVKYFIIISKNGYLMALKLQNKEKAPKSQILNNRTAE
jgi:hypothetical protein